MDKWDYGDEEENALDDWTSDEDFGKGESASSSGVMQVLEYCVIPVIQQTFRRIFPLICLTIFTGELLQRGVKGTVANIICILAGAMIVGSLVDLEEGILFILVMMSTYSFIIISANHSTGKVYISLFLLVLAYLVFREHVPLFGSNNWAQIRGIVMIALMKTVSLIFDLIRDKRMDTPSATEYFAYIFYPGTVAFGPWVSYSEHSMMLGRFALKTDYQGWFLLTMSKLLCSSMHLMLSTCFIHFYFMGTTSRFYLLFRDAATVRFSHYFICQLSEALYGMAGPRSAKEGLSTHVVTVLEVEFPSSLVDVVVNWNIPMHRWLKKHVYSPLLRNMGRTKAGLLTFLASAMLHGLNVRLTAVLMSLALFCYIEYSFRRTFSDFTSSCVEARHCRRCTHKYRKDLVVQFVNFLFLLFAVFNLAYLGVIMDEDEDQSTVSGNWISMVGQQLSRWTEFNCCAHFIMFLILCSDFIMRLFL